VDVATNKCLMQFAEMLWSEKDFVPGKIKIEA
jgi:hypothetical protein